VSSLGQPISPAAPTVAAPAREHLLRRGGRRLLGDLRVPLSLAVLGAIVLAALLAPWIAPDDPERMGAGRLLEPPSLAHPMGIDNYGRDQLSRVIYGTRISLLVSAIIVVGALAIGLPIGMLAGFRGGGIDNLLMRVVDIMLAFPWILVAMGIATLIGPGLNTVVVALAIVYSPQVARLARAAVLAEREREYVLAARVVGTRAGDILLRHIMPNAASPLLVQAISIMSFSILAEASLSYLGLGTQPPTPSWGLMLAESGFYMGAAPHMAIFPGLAIVLLVLALNMFGDALRDELDPRYRSNA
jgi:peptide/nickel transport system permease protein